MRTALVIASKDLRQRFRDRSVIVLGFVAPLAIAVLMSFAFSGAENFHMNVGVVDADRGPVAVGLLGLLRSADLRDIVTLKSYSAAATAESALHKKRVDAVLVIPTGFSAAATTSTPKDIEVLTSVDSVLAGQVSQSIVDSFVAQVNADRLSVATAVAAGVPAGSIASMTAAAADLRLPIQLAAQPPGRRPLKAISYYAPAMGIFFAFFSINFTTRGYFTEQRAGTLERMGAAVAPGTILLGKALAVFAYGCASLATMVVFTSVVFHADWGGPAPAAALCVLMVSSIVALTALVIALSRTERQAESLSAIVVFALALTGGNFTFISESPALLRRLALFTPNGWALRGFVDVATGPHSLGAIGQPLLAMSAITLAIAVVAVFFARRSFAT